MKALKLLFFLSVTSIFAQVPANNECANAEAIIISTTTPLTISADFAEATESLDASCNTASTDNKDLWYQFTMPIDGILYIDGPSTLNYYTLYNSCGGAEIACSQDDASFGNLLNGNIYLLRASYQFTNTTSFSLMAIEPASNDACENRETLSLSTTTFTQPNPDSITATKSIDGSCDTSDKTYVDLWYDFVMPTTGNVEITFSNNRQTFALFDSCAGVELQCFVGPGIFQNLASGSTYVIRVAERTTDVGAMNFRLQAFEFAANDACSNSQNILVETSDRNTYQADLRTATESVNSSCETASNTNYDLWFNFTMPVTGNLKIDQLTGLDTATVYDGCGGAEISCQSGLQFIPGLIAGTNYIVRISSIIQANKTPRFQAFPIAINDECADSEFISVDTLNYIEYTADTRMATESLDSSCDTTSDTNLDLWYEFEMPVSGNLQLSNVSFQFKSALYDACSGTEIDCSSGNNTYEDLALNATYKLRVSQRLNEANTANFRLQAFENIYNDDCATPQDITIIENEFSTYATNNAAATDSTISSCEPSSENLTVLDVWYRFTMPSNNAIEIVHLNDALVGYYALYDTCGTTELQCFIDDGFFNDLIAGNEYLLKVGGLSSQSGVLRFSIGIASPLSISDHELNSFSIFPNPTSHSITISNRNQHQLKQMSLYDLSGRKIKELNLENDIGDISIDMSALQNAMYVLEISTEKGEITKRVIKQ